VIALVGQTLAHVSHPTQLSSSTTGFPLKFSKGLWGSAGNEVVYAGEKSDTRASAISRIFGYLI
jgi:hypothetical protein